MGQFSISANKQVNWSDPALCTRALREYLEALDEEALAETLSKAVADGHSGPLDRCSRRPSFLRSLKLTH